MSRGVRVYFMSEQHRYFSLTHTKHGMSTVLIEGLGFTCALCRNSASRTGRRYCFTHMCPNNSYYDMFNQDPCAFCTSTSYWSCSECNYNLCSLCGGKNIFFNFLERVPVDVLCKITSYLPLNSAIQLEICCKQFYRQLIKNRTELSINKYTLTPRDIQRLCSRYSNPYLNKLSFTGVLIRPPKIQEDTTAYVICEAIRDSFPSLGSLDLSENWIRIIQLTPLLELQYLQELKLNNIKLTNEWGETNIVRTDWEKLVDCLREAKLKRLEAKNSSLPPISVAVISSLGIELVA